jgi:hypothetical protein
MKFLLKARGDVWLAEPSRRCQVLQPCLGTWYERPLRGHYFRCWNIEAYLSHRSWGPVQRYRLYQGPKFLPFRFMTLSKFRSRRNTECEREEQAVDAVLKWIHAWMARTWGNPGGKQLIFTWSASRASESNIYFPLGSCYKGLLPMRTSKR